MHRKRTQKGIDNESEIGVVNRQENRVKNPDVKIAEAQKEHKAGKIFEGGNSFIDEFQFYKVIKFSEK